MGAIDAGDSRLQLLNRWVQDDLGITPDRIVPASADASFRRYFRVTRGSESFIVMDAPPAKENLEPFLQVGGILAGIGINVPMVLARHLSEGFLLLTDLGSRQYLDELLANRRVEELYGDALGALTRMQTAGRAFVAQLPPYDATLLIREMDLLPEWFLNRHLGMELAPTLRAMLERLYGVLVESATAQPQTLVHRDYHSRNLMIVPRDNPGILDFQDAVAGPITYDLVSLLKDCYVGWPEERVRGWALGYRNRLLQTGFEFTAGEAEFLRWFDLMGLQRHIKVLGIFCRLFYRDQKSQYLNDLPRVLRYAERAAAAYPETAEFADFLRMSVAPLFAAAQRRVLV
jgi:aminoglycoside/choline kinase family phosphotransferase